MAAMWFYLALASFLVARVKAFAPAPIRWGGLPARRFMLSPSVSPSKVRGPFPKLTIMEHSSSMANNEISQFVVRGDSTIAWSGTSMCIEAAGDRSGDEIHVSRCTGKSTQLWNFLPSSRDHQNQIQLKGSHRCIAVNDKGGLEGASVELEDCDDRTTKSWKFERPISLPQQASSQHFGSRSPIQHVMFFLISMSVLGALSLNSWMWRRHEMLESQRSKPSDLDHGGLCLTESSAIRTSVQRMIPAVLAVAPTPGDDEDSVRNSVERSLQVAMSNKDPAVEGEEVPSDVEHIDHQPDMEDSIQNSVETSMQAANSNKDPVIEGEENPSDVEHKDHQPDYGTADGMQDWHDGMEDDLMPSGSEHETWQSRLDKSLLDVDLEPGERLQYLAEALRDPSFSTDVREAVGVLQEKGLEEGQAEFINRLYPKGTRARSDIEGLKALSKQLPEYFEEANPEVRSVLQDLTDPAAWPALGDKISQFQEEIQESAKDVLRPRGLEEVFDGFNALQEETKDLFRSVPKGLEAPEYTLVRKFEGSPEMGVRAYEEFTVARTSMKDSVGGNSFRTLAGYLFGKNEDKREMKMTTPVEISSSATDKDGRMAFVLPKSYADAPPAPLAGSDIAVEKVPARLVAFKTFTGIVTSAEVERQKSALLQAITADGSYVPLDDNESCVLQYNSPFSIPWRRCNEVAIVVTKKEEHQSEMHIVTTDAQDTEIKAVELPGDTIVDEQD